jgi:hypothetical protein
MGLPEFGVETAPDREILHEFTFPPAHNHIGDVLPIPYDELVVGAYTTRQLEAETEQEAEAVADFNAEIEANGVLDLVVDNLVRLQSLPVSNLRFTNVPTDAPALLHVLEEFQHKIELENQELYNGWGGIVITQNQDNLKRVDLFVVWDQVELEGGNVVLDESGQPIPVMAMQAVLQQAVDADGNPVVDEAGQPMMEPVIGADGEPVTEIVLDESGNPTPVRFISSEHVFIHENSGYFD